MTGTQLATRIRKYTGTTSTTYTDAQALADVNVVKDEIAAQIAQRNPQKFIIPATFDLVASTVTAREYSFPSDVLNHIVTLELALDTAQPTVFVPCTPYPGGLQKLLRDLNGITEAKITNLFTNEEPHYVLQRDGILILSGTISALSGGGKLRYRLYPADLASLSGSTDLSLDPTTTSFGMPKNFHELWARRTSIFYKTMRPNPMPLSALEKVYETDLKVQLDAISESDLGGEDFGWLPPGDSASELGANV